MVLKRGIDIMITDRNYTVIDIETTGLSPLEDEIIELSALKVRDNKVVKEFSSLINPNKEISDFISSLTGITQSMVQNAPDIKTVLPLFIDFIGDDTVLGHNVSFDLGFIRTKYKRCFGLDFHNQQTDTMKIAKKAIKLRNYKLTTIAQYYHIDTRNNHRGLKDCYITFEVYKLLTTGTAKVDTGSGHVRII